VKPNNSSVLIPDAEFSIDARTTWIDVSVVDPTAPSYARAADNAIRTREIKKFNHYRPILRDDTVFYPFVIDCFGSYGQYARDFLSRLADEAEHLGFRPSIFEDFSPIAQLRRHISFELQRGNSLMIERGRSSLAH